MRKGGSVLRSCPPTDNFRSEYMLAIRCPKRNSLQVRTKPGENVELPPFVFLPSDQSISGIVVDRQGRPVAGARLTAWTGPNPSEDQGIGSAKVNPTGGDGRFTMTGLPKIPVILEVGFLVPDKRGTPQWEPAGRVRASRGRKTSASKSTAAASKSTGGPPTSE